MNAGSFPVSLFPLHPSCHLPEREPLSRPFQGFLNESYLGKNTPILCSLPGTLLLRIKVGLWEIRYISALENPLIRGFVKVATGLISVAQWLSIDL